MSHFPYSGYCNSVNSVGNCFEDYFYWQCWHLHIVLRNVYRNIRVPSKPAGVLLKVTDLEALTSLICFLFMLHLTLPWVSKTRWIPCLCTMHYLDSPLVQHVLASWWPAGSWGFFIHVQILLLFDLLVLQIWILCCLDHINNDSI